MGRNITVLRLILSVVLISLLVGCASRSASKKPKILEANPAARVIKIEIDREKLKHAISQPELTNRIRIVELYGAGITYPQYRVFGIKKGSMWEQIGLEERDTLLAVNDFIIDRAWKFVRFVQLMPSLNETEKPSIRVRREGEELRVEFELGE